MIQTDPFGMAFSDFLERGKASIVIERDDGYLDDEDVSSYFGHFESFPKCEKKALTHVKGRVLDIGVGAGRVALHLQGQGLDVVGIDVSEGALEVSRRRGVRFVQKMSACALEFEKASFDTAVAFGNNFGLCGTPDKVSSMLRSLRKILSKDGVILVGSIDPLNTALPEHLKYHKANLARGRLEGHVTVRLRYGEIVGEWFDLLLVTPAQMSDMCAGAGWRIDKLYRSPEPSPVYAAVLTKKG